MLDHWAQIEELFTQGLEQGQPGRESLLTFAEPEVARAVEALWRNHERAGQFLQKPIVLLDLHRFAVGRVLGGRFFIEEFLGAGGMGEVYRARDRSLGRMVAVKALRPDLAWDDDAKRLLLREARSLCASNHPRICALHEVGRDGDITFLIMELLGGETLAARLQKGPLELHEMLMITEQVLDGLSNAHAQGVVHGDLKPTNIMLTEFGVKLLDFGIAQRTAIPTSDGQTLANGNGVVAGSVAYMSPEQAAGAGIDARSDVFSLGAVMYEMLTGRRAFPQDSAPATVLESDPQHARKLAPKVPIGLVTVIERCLSKNAADRYKNAAEAAVAVREMREREIRRRRHLLPLAVILAVVVASIASAALWRFGPSRASTPIPKLRRMIDDDANCTFPDLSPDGKLLVYSSNRAGSLDLWLQAADGGRPTRLTTQPGAEDAPVFSPDGSEIAYHSEQDGGGIYIIPAGGGPSRLLARNGNEPTYSPDGRNIAYWEGEPTSSVATGSTKVFIRPAKRGPARQIAADLIGAQGPVFSADGTRLLVERFETGAGGVKVPTIFCARLDNGPSIQTRIAEDLRKQGLVLPIISYWGPDMIVIQAWLGDSSGIWRVPFDSRRLAVTGRVIPVIVGAERSAFAKVRGAKVVFHSGTFSYNAWTLPLRANQAVPTGPAQQATLKVGYVVTPELAPDGRLLAYSYIPHWDSHHDITEMQTILRDLGSGAETSVSRQQLGAWSPRFFRDSNHLILASGSETNATVFETSATQSEVLPVSKDCRHPSVSPSGRWLICQSDDNDGLSVLEISTRQRADILLDAKSTLWGSRISPDERWITWVGSDKESGLSRIFVAPFRGRSLISRPEWVPVVTGESWSGNPAWSPDGSLIYYLSDRDGPRCIYAQRLNRETKRPEGSPIAVYHAHGSQRLDWISQNWQNLSVATDKIAFLQPESKYTIWMADLK